MNFLTRIEREERRRGCGGDWNITLHLPDGSQRVIPLRGKKAFDQLYDRCLQDRYCPEAKIFREAIQVDGPHGSLLGELIQSMVLSPWEDPDPARQSEPATPLPEPEPTPAAPEPASPVSLAPILIIGSPKGNA